MTISRLIQTGLALMMLFAVLPVATHAQRQNPQTALCVTMENTVVLVAGDNPACKQIWYLDTSLASMLETLQQMQGVQGEFYKALLELLLTQNDEIIAHILKDTSNMPSAQIVNPLSGTSMMPANPFLEQMSGAVSVSTSGNGVGVIVSQQNGGPANVTVQTGSDQHTFTVDSED